jgi:hypothetical protein
MFIVKSNASTGEPGPATTVEAATIEPRNSEIEKRVRTMGNLLRIDVNRLSVAAARSLRNPPPIRHRIADQQSDGRGYRQQ